MAAIWTDYYEPWSEADRASTGPRGRLDQWVAWRTSPIDADNYLGTVAISVEDVLRYST